MKKQPGIGRMTAAQFREYVATHRESAYWLVDVRQPSEYTAGHIPGAVFLPLPELESRLFELPGDKDMVFYCHSGGRSLAAASLALEGEVTSGNIFNLEGGISAWDGKLLPDFPRIHVFTGDGTPAETLFTAMDLEKGAWRFYRGIGERFAHIQGSEGLAELSEAEIAHARMVYVLWKPLVENPPAFETLFEELAGDILEGGLSMEEAISRIPLTGERPWRDFIETALDIEFTAFDLYRTMAEKRQDDKAREAFLTLAQAEKAHMRMLIRVLGKTVS